MGFTAPAEHYDRFMGRYSAPLAVALCDAAGIGPGARVVDVGCGPGSLTRELVVRTGAANVAAIDPAEQFVAACAERNPGIDARHGGAEELPWADASFDAALACLVIGFMSDPDHGVREMARVTRPGGVVAACMWDVPSDGMAMLATFWRAVRAAVDADAVGERSMPGTTEGDIAARFASAGLADVAGGALTVHVAYSGFEDFWEPFTYGVGPAGAYLRSLAPEAQAAVREACRTALPDGPFELDARAWYATGTVS